MTKKLSRQEELFLDEMMERSREICRLLGICEICGEESCTHKKSPEMIQDLEEGEKEKD